MNKPDASGQLCVCGHTRAAHGGATGRGACKATFWGYCQHICACSRFVNADSPEGRRRLERAREAAARSVALDDEKLTGDADPRHAIEREKPVENGANFLDSCPFDLSHPSAKELLRILVDTYPLEPDAIRILRAASIPPASVNWNQPMRTAWPEILVVARGQNKLRSLVSAVASDPCLAPEIATEVRRLADDSTATAPDGGLADLERRWALERRDVSTWTDAELVDVLTERYAPSAIPPCRVCGGRLSVAASGGGCPTLWACSAQEDDPDRPGWLRLKAGRGGLGELEPGGHYSRSRHEDPRRGGDRAVMEAMKRLDRALARERAALDERDGYAASLAEQRDRLAAAEQEIARLRALVPQVAETAEAYGEVDYDEQPVTASALRRGLTTLLDDAARDGRRP